jgi:DNA-binding NarL/FixJ family response regulator
LLAVLAPTTHAKERPSTNERLVSALSSVRVLVVDDYEPFRSSVCSTLEKRPEFQIVGQASDGLEALQEAEKLQPDLILLDIGLPTLNGIDAARRIRMVSAKSKIVFISQESSADVAQEAFNSGARGYLVKTDAGIELLIAINAVLRGERFVSSSLASNDPDRNKAVVSFPPQNLAIRHEVAFYADDAALVDGFARFLEGALSVENAAILIATAEHRSDILQRLRANAVDVDGALKNGSFVQLDALDTASTLMVNDLPDPVRCAKVGDVVIEAFKNAKGAHPRVAICGEGAPALLREGKAEAAIRLEHFWDEITRRYHADTLCGYLWTLFPQRESSPMFARVCAEHSAVVRRELDY